MVQNYLITVKNVKQFRKKNMKLNKINYIESF